MATIGEYRIIKMLGKGSYSKVFLGEHQETKEQYAIKIMK